MFKKIGFDVIKLQRVAIGKLRIGSLERGAFVYLNDAARERVFMQDLPAETGIREHRPKSTKKSIKPTKKKFEKGLRISDSKDA